VGGCALDVPDDQRPWGVEVLAGEPPGCRLLASSGGAAGLATPRGGQVAATLAVNFEPCVPAPQTLCLDDLPGDRRFEVTAAYETVQDGGRSGFGGAVPLEILGVRRGGLLWFFNLANPEMLVKVLNGCAINGHYWVFHSAGTNVGFDLTVRDTQRDEAVLYSNPDLNPAPPVQDINALPCGL
jgi:hypothetical protein